MRVCLARATHILPIWCVVYLGAGSRPYLENRTEGTKGMTVALVTGANRGLGLATAKRLANQGVEVVIAARDAGDAQKAAVEVGNGATAVALDVTNRGSIAKAVGEVEQRHGRLDILINNAGILPEATNANPAEIVDVNMFESTFATNLLGPVATLEAFLPLLRKSEAGRIVNVTTTMGSLQDQVNPDSPFFGMVMPAYQSSKAALNNVTIALAKQLGDTKIKVTSVCPGFVKTDLTPMNKEQAPTTADEASETVVRAATLPDDAPSGQFIDATGTVPW